MKVLATCALILGLPFIGQASEDASSIFKNYSPNIVQIESSVGVGTGFFYSSDIVISNRHVVFGFDGISKSWYFPKTFHLKDGTKLTTFNFMVCSKRVDLCVISLNYKNKGNDFKFSNKEIKPGEDVFVIGHPRGIPVPIISTGIISSNASQMPGLDFKYDTVQYQGFTTNASISQGSSGSPVITKDGEIVGLISSMMKDAQNLNFAITSEEINNFITKASQKNFDDVIYLEPGFEKKLNVEFSSFMKKIVDVEPVQKTEEPKPVPQADPAIIRDVLISGLPKFKSCYQSEMDSTGREYSGFMKLKFTINPAGQVADATAETPADLPARLKNCVIGTLERLTFPQPMGGGKVEVTQPMNFYPKRT